MKASISYTAILFGISALIGPVVAISQENPTPASNELFYSKDRPLLPPRRSVAPESSMTGPAGPISSTRVVLETPEMLAPNPELAPTVTTPGSAAVIPTSRTIKGVNNTEESREPLGATASGSRADAYTIEDIRPERVAVFPDDPNSAWWEVNPRVAFLRAQREQKPMLLLFTGDWNSKALKLSEEVFSTKSFNNFVRENLVICYLSYPRNITDAPMSLRNLKEKYNVKGYPNVLIFNPQGEVDCHISGYRTGRPVDYFNRMKQLVWPIQERIKVRKRELAKHGYRDWYGGDQDTNIFAKFVKRDTDLVTLRGVNGKEWTINMTNLSEEDHAFSVSFPSIDEVVSLDQLRKTK